MPQTKRDAVHRYYTYDPSNNKSKCKLCGYNLKGKHTTNLKNHISIKHSEEYLAMTNINKAHHKTRTSRDEVVIDKVKNNCVKLVTVHGRPFTLIQDKAFQEIINIAVPSNTRSKHININIIKGMIPEKSQEIKSKIASEVKNNLISLKLDSATYLDKHFLGINLQYIKEGKIIIRNLAVLEVLERPTGDFLKESLLEVLNDFKILPTQIYSITTDYGSNFKKITKHCSKAKDDIIYGYDMNEDNDEDNDDDDTEQVDEKYILNIDSFLITMKRESFQPRAMLCAAYTFQLAVKDAIARNVHVQTCIEHARKATKILRRPNMKNIIKFSNANKPLTDCSTRWSATYQMLMQLVSLRHICDSDPELSNIVSEDFWVQVENLTTCLKPVNDATIALQQEQLTISDFYIEWLNCKAKVESTGISFANELAQCMKARESTFLSTDMVLENLYLDGRLNVVLSDQESIKAQSLICETFRQLEKLNFETLDIKPDIKAIASSSRLDTEHSSHISDLERILQETEAIRGLPRKFSLNTFEVTLSNLRFKPRLPLQENILTYWANKEVTDNQSLINVANCILAAPATQVSLERLYSSVKFMLNPSRSNLSGSLLQDIMLIRSNQDLYN